MTLSAKLCRAVFFAAALATPLAAAQSAAPVAQLRPSPQSIDFAPVAANDGMTLTVIGPDGTVYERHYAGGSAASFRVSDIPRSATVNGTFTWELRATPKIDSLVKSQLAAARAANDDAEIARITRANNLGDAFVQSGVFTILNGSILPGDAIEPVNGKATAASRMNTMSQTSTPRSAPVRASDIVNADDVIVQGSLCVGFDCVDNESFGFDTIRLKENNTRIKFQDTSTSAGYPTNDWQLTANDNASGGDSKFSIEDIDNAKVPFTIRAGAATNSLFVDTNGKVGLRTSEPGLDLHIATGNTPAIRLAQDSSGGFTAQTWDMGANEANFFVRDITGGSRLPFRIRPGAPTSSIDISANGNVGIGKASNVNGRLDISDSTQIASRITLSGQEFLRTATTSDDGIAVLLGVNRVGNRQMWITDSTMLNGPTPALRFSPNTGDFSAISISGGVVSPADLRINAAGGNVGIGKAPTKPIDHVNGAYLSTGGVWTNASSRSLKHDICDLDAETAKQTLEDLAPVTYAYDRDPNEHHVGFIAEDVPALVATQDRKGLSSMDIVAVLTKVVQEQQKTIEQLEKRLEKVEKQ